MLRDPQPAQSALRVRREQVVQQPIFCKAAGSKSQRGLRVVRP